ncbi:thymopoietin [Tupaia chinensis]|uniref:thymopoietin n=1 Tax=Tupaia chinensis TaxID=246437 RepID=UPI000FFC9B2F|nr:thymopoietin [Tupaia chinensis]
MPEFLEDPSVLTKDKLKSELVANNVTLPAGEQRKDVYVQLYLQHLTPRNRPPLAAGAHTNGAPAFSLPRCGVPGPGRAGRGGRAQKLELRARDFGCVSLEVWMEFVCCGVQAARGDLMPRTSDPRERCLPREPRKGRSLLAKATKKTDKPRIEDKDDLDVTELSNEDLLDQLVKYGVNPGPIVGTTRKLYEKKLLKLREQGTESRSSTPLPTISSSENTRQNGSNDSDRYSDNEEDSKIELKLEKREPLKGRAKTPVTLKQRRIEHNQSYSQPGVSETEWTSGSSAGGPLHALTRESTRGSRRTPRKRVEASEHYRIDGAIISESTPIAETIMASSNETLVVNRVTGNFKHATPILPITEFSDIPRRTPKKPLTRAEVGEKTEDRRVERDILKEMFPFEASTPTGISASCRRPIKGAAGRPLELSDFRMEESFSSKYVPKYVPLADVKSEKTKKGRSVPVWIKILLFVIVAVFLFLVYQAMETNQGNPFLNFLPTESRESN